MYMDCNTNTSGWLYMMKRVIFKTRNGDLPNVANVAIMITDRHTTRKLCGVLRKVCRNQRSHRMNTYLAESIHKRPSDDGLYTWFVKGLH